MTVNRAMEYRVRWRREGLESRRQMFQTLAGAEGKKERLERLEEDKHMDELSWMREYGGEVMPDLVGPVEIEERDVGTWSPHVR